MYQCREGETGGWTGDTKQVTTSEGELTVRKWKLTDAEKELRRQEKDVTRYCKYTDNPSWEACVCTILKENGFCYFSDWIRKGKSSKNKYICQSECADD